MYKTIAPTPWKTVVARYGTTYHTKIIMNFRPKNRKRERESKSMGGSKSNSCGVMYVWIRKTQSIYNALFMRFRWLQSKLYNRSTSVNQTKPKQPGQKKNETKISSVNQRTYVHTDSFTYQWEREKRPMWNERRRWRCFREKMKLLLREFPVWNCMICSA